MCQTLGLSTLGRHQKHVQIAVSIAGKSKLRSVARPDGMPVPTIICGQCSSQTTFAGYNVHFTLVAERDLFPIRRDCGVTKPVARILGESRCCKRKSHANCDEETGKQASRSAVHRSQLFCLWSESKSPAIVLHLERVSSHNSAQDLHSKPHQDAQVAATNLVKPRGSLRINHMQFQRKSETAAFAIELHLR